MSEPLFLVSCSSMPRSCFVERERLLVSCDAAGGVPLRDGEVFSWPGSVRGAIFPDTLSFGTVCSCIPALAASVPIVGTAELLSCMSDIWSPGSGWACPLLFLPLGVVLLSACSRVMARTETELWSFLCVSFTHRIFPGADIYQYQRYC